MKKFAITAAVLALICLGWFFGGWLVDTEPQAPSIRDKASDAKSKSVPVPSTSASAESTAKQAASGEEGYGDSDQAEIERCKKIDIEHMTNAFKVPRDASLKLQKHRERPKLTPEQEAAFRAAEVCHVCGKGEMTR